MIWGLRAAFAIILAMIGRTVVITWWGSHPEWGQAPWWWGSFAGLATSAVFIFVEVAFTRRFIAVISVVMFGIVFGFIASFLFVQTLFLIPAFREAGGDLREWIQYSSLAIFCYIGVVGILQSKDDFKFVIPFVELKREEKGPKPLILDTSVIIDGRIADIVDTKILTAPIIVPRFVLQELQTVADSQDKLKRGRGRRGLDMLQRMQKSTVVDLYDAKLPGVGGVDAKLVALAKHLDARIVTNDFNLNKVAQLQGVEVINVNDLANAMKPALMPGEVIEVKVLKPGQERGQGVGFLEDGTMVVVEGGYRHIGGKVIASVTNAVQTSAGRMIFAEIKNQSSVPQTREETRNFPSNPPQGSGAAGDAERPGSQPPAPRDSGASEEAARRV